MRSNRRRQRSRKYFWIFLGLILAIMVAGTVYGLHEYHMVKSPQKPGSEEVIEVAIPEGSTQSDIAKILQENGLISSDRFFNLYIRLEHNQPVMKAGHYQLSPSMSADEIISSLVEGSQDVSDEALSKITIPEGVTVERIASIIERDTQHSAQEFLKLIKDATFLKELLEMYPFLLSETMNNEEVTYKLEGYLFPATYDITEDTTLRDIVLMMVGKTAEVIDQYNHLIDQSAFSTHEILTLASFIEGEGVRQEDREMISGVFYNRLNSGMPLQTDVSISYVLDERREIHSLEEVQVESPYNTYINTGLGPGPVNNPSESAIKAALNPTETDYLFFLADLKTGEIYYSETYEKHLELQKQYINETES